MSQALGGLVLHAEHGIGRRKLSQFSRRSVEDFRDRIRTVGVTVSTTRKIIATLHSVLEHAISQDWIATNAARGVKVRGKRGEGSKKIEPPSKDNMRALIDAAGDELRLMLLFAASTGARAGEQWAVRWRDVIFDKGELSISRRVDAYGEEGPPKSSAGVRTVPLSGQLVAMLKAWKLKSQFSKPDDLIFSNRAGHHFGHDNLIKRQFLPLFEKLPAIKPFNWHSLRHFAVSCWIEAGLAPKTVQTFAGHASLQVTMDRYGHMFPSADHQKGNEPNRQGAVHVNGERLANERPSSMCHPCDMDTPAQNDTRRESLDFIGIWQHHPFSAIFGQLSAGKSPLSG